MLFKNLHINPDSVELDDQLIERPFYLAPSVWVGFWEASLQVEDQAAADEIESLENEVDDLQGEVKRLEEEIGSLEIEITDLESSLKDAEREIADLEKQLAGG